MLAVNALKKMENILTMNNNKIDAVVDSYDGTAGGDIQALTEQGLAGKVAVSGQDAELAGCQRIVAGTQSVTFYKPVKYLAAEAAEIAVKLAKGEPLPAARPRPTTIKRMCPVISSTPSRSPDNMVSSVIADGFQKMEDVYKDVREGSMAPKREALIPGF